MMRYLLLSVLVVCVIGIMIPSAFGDDAKVVFEKKKNGFLSYLTSIEKNDPELFPYSFELERDFTIESGSTESHYQLYKLIDTKTNKIVGDLRFYLGSSEWWDNNADLQEDDTSGFSDVFKVKIFLYHYKVPTVVQQMSEHLTVTLLILVPEWSDEFNETENEWLVDSLNNAERKEHHGTDKREGIITTENKEIIVLHDDEDYGSMTVIITENADTISLGSETTGCGTGTVLVDGVCELASEESNDGCGEGTVLVDGVCQLDKSSGTSIPQLYIASGAAAIGAAVIVIIFAVRRGSSGTKIPKPAKKELEKYEEKYLAKQKPSPKPAKKKETSAFCENCGKPLKPEAKFCGKCGTPRS